MAQLRQDFPAFKATDTEIIVIGPEDQATFQVYWKEHDLPFTGLPDPNHTVLKLYGQKINLFKFGRMPAMVIVDRKGVARFAHYGHEMSDIPRNIDVLNTLRQLSMVAE